MRRLVSTQRVVPPDQVASYRAAWDAVNTAVRALGGNAWIFCDARDDNRFLEFIEWSDANVAPLDTEGVREAVAQLDAIAPAESDEWREAE